MHPLPVMGRGVLYLHSGKRKNRSGKNGKSESSWYNIFGIRKATSHGHSENLTAAATPGLCRLFYKQHMEIAQMSVPN